jgi:N-dimethylarginine dimethylaminohydrolase
MRRLLLCPPKYYSVDYEINPWMHVQVKPDREKALAQWNAYVKTLGNLGIKIELIEPVEKLPDMVFTANGGLVHGKKFIVSNFRYPQRQGEAAHFERWFREKGFEIIKLPEEVLFEGEGDAFIIGDTLVAGFRFRSDIRSHNLIAEALGMRVISLECSSPDFYHLDTCFSPLNRDTALIYPKAFDKYGLKALSNIFSDIIEVGEEDAKKFCCNAVVAGRDIIMNNSSDELTSTLQEKGFNPVQLDFSEYIKAGGSAKCLALKLDLEEE